MKLAAPAGDPIPRLDRQHNLTVGPGQKYPLKRLPAVASFTVSVSSVQFRKGANALSLDDYPDHIITRAWFTAPHWHATFDRPRQSRDGHDFHIHGASEEEVVAKCAQAIRERAAGPDCPGILKSPGMKRWLIPAWEAKSHLLEYNINPKIAALEATIRHLRAALDGATIAADARAHG